VEAKPEPPKPPPPKPDPPKQVQPTPEVVKHTEVVAAATPAAIDLGVSVGVDVWAAGAPVDPSLGLTFTGGYRLPWLSNASIETPAGARIGLTFVSEMNTDTFASILFDPMVSFALIP